MTTYLPLYTKAAGASGAPALASDPSCILYVPFWKKDGTTFTSDDKYGHIITNYGTTKDLKGRVFDGVDDFILGHNNPLFNPADAISIIVWANQTPLNDNSILVCRYTSDWLTYYHGWRMYASKSGTFDFIFSDGTYPPSFQSSGAVATQGIWNMYAVTYDRALVRYYLNGRLVKSNVVTCAINNYNGPLNFGQYNIFSGSKGEVLEFTRRLSDGEVNDYYLATKSRYL
jgi:hypothetical protein